MKKRKIIQLLTARNLTNEWLFALADDGTVWRRSPSNTRTNWTKVYDLPTWDKEPEEIDEIQA